MATFTQADRDIRVETPLGGDALLLEGFSGEEAISTLFSYSLDMVSTNASISASSLLGQPCAIVIKVPTGRDSSEDRYIHGRIRRFVQLGKGKELTIYGAELVPWLWFLTLSSNCRVFQKKSALEIIEQVFKDAGYRDFEVQCRSCPKREYCVQYRETDFNFVSRLLEEEGISYYFKHSKDKHTLVLVDDQTQLNPCPGQPKAHIAKPGAFQETDVVTAFQIEQAVYLGGVVLRDYDYLQPTVELESTVTGKGTGRVYDYPGSNAELGGASDAPQTLERNARLLLEEQETSQLVARGTSSCRGFQSGHKFDLEQHYRSNLNQSYRLLSVRHSAHAGTFESGSNEALDYQNAFVATPQSVKFRPPRTAAKPVMYGSQTALVVGKSGQEIWVDKHGRVKVQFYWDREGKKDENTSCWVRVATVWAGKAWGGIQIPRIGQEVIVDFLDGDPDRPIITGRVYNADQVPPYALPDNQTQSGVKSRSSQKGGTDNFNELRFEDKKGSEEIFFHAEKDLKTETEHDETRTVGNDRTTTIENNDTRTVTKGNDAVTVKQGNQTVIVEMGNQEITLKQGNQKIVVSMGNQELKVDMGNVSTKAALGKIAQEAMQSIELKVGQSSLKIDQTGVTIKGLNVKVEGQVMAEMKGVMTTVKGDGMLTVKGGITMIN
jgi:type VI secretion system secreted protein VgrG